MEKIYCDICPGSVPMKLDHKFKTRTTGKKYRVRRFVCSVCGFMKTIFGDGSGDDQTIPQQGIDQINAIYKQEEKNREI